jgi:hypothetical protein
MPPPALPLQPLLPRPLSLLPLPPSRTLQPLPAPLPLPLATQPRRLLTPSRSPDQPALSSKSRLGNQAAFFMPAH